MSTEAEIEIRQIVEADDFGQAVQSFATTCPNRVSFCSRKHTRKLIPGKQMISIASAANTEAPCFLALVELGFAVTVHHIDGTERWVAQKGDLTITADEGPCMLLGLAKLIELRGEHWSATDADIEQFVQMVSRSENAPDTTTSETSVDCL